MFYDGLYIFVEFFLSNAILVSVQIARPSVLVPSPGHMGLTHNLFICSSRFLGHISNTARLASPMQHLAFVLVIS